MTCTAYNNYHLPPSGGSKVFNLLQPRLFHSFLIPYSKASKRAYRKNKNQVIVGVAFTYIR